VDENSLKTSVGRFRAYSFHKTKHFPLDNHLYL